MLHKTDRIHVSLHMAYVTYVQISKRTTDTDSQNTHVYTKGLFMIKTKTKTRLTITLLQTYIKSVNL